MMIGVDVDERAVKRPAADTNIAEPSGAKQSTTWRSVAQHNTAQSTYHETPRKRNVDRSSNGRIDH
jgi:hypothetical protein